MTLAPGSRLGSYEILAAIGAGGMGEVYRARDARLRRDVAVKVLPESFASDEARQRFLLLQARPRTPDVITEISVVQNWIEELKGRR